MKMYITSKDHFNNSTFCITDSTDCFLDVCEFRSASELEDAIHLKIFEMISCEDESFNLTKSINDESDVHKRNDLIKKSLIYRHHSCINDHK